MLNQLDAYRKQSPLSDSIVHENVLILSLSQLPNELNKNDPIIQKIKSSIKELLNQGIDLASIVSCWGDSVIHIMAFKQLTELLKWTIKTAKKFSARLSLDTLDKKIGHTPLHLSCVTNNLEMTQSLLIALQEESRAEQAVNKADQSGKTPLHMIAYIKEKLDNAPQAPTDKMNACNAIIALLENNGADWDIEDQQEFTPRDVLEGRAKKQIFPNISVNFFGQTNFALLLVRNLFSQAQKLLEPLTAEQKHIVINNLDYLNRNVGCYVIYQCYPDFLKWLLDNGLELNHKDNCDQTLAHFASFPWKDNEDNAKSLKILIEKGATVDILNGSNQTPLDIAEQYNFSSAVNLLTEQGFKPQMFHS